MTNNIIIQKPRVIIIPNHNTVMQTEEGDHHQYEPQ